ncbi:MAG TPA: hypothetical protein VD971_05920 [Phycisphaerales bacterium]|nr:hypothetical protein [Phycisphaerales bacterium]
MALCEVEGQVGGSPPPSGAQPRVVAQWTWDAYGNVISAEYLHPHPFLRLGHKGLFCERIDADLLVEDGGGGYEENPRAVPYSQLLYHVRNRTLSPGLGRWLQRDPNATGQNLFGDGSAFALGIADHFGDGLNTTEYLGGNSLAYTDPWRLFEFSIAVFFGGAASTAELQSEWTQQVGETGLTMRNAMNAWADTFAIDQWADVY